MKWIRHELFGLSKANAASFPGRISSALHYSRKKNKIFVAVENSYDRVITTDTGSRLRNQGHRFIHLECLQPNQQQNDIFKVRQQDVEVNLYSSELNQSFWKETRSRIYWFNFEPKSSQLQVYLWHSGKFILICKQSGLKADSVEPVWYNSSTHDVFLKKEPEPNESGYHAHKFYKFAVIRY